MTRRVILISWGVLLVACMAFPQANLGRLQGVVTDAQGLVLPGVTITLTGEALIGQRLANADVDGSYRFPALNPGTYNILYEMSGFQTLNREGIVITTGRTITVNITLNLATVAETITVTGESPVVDVKTTGVGATYDATTLEDIPSASDMWAVLQNSPGIRMRAFDVGGSHKSQQSGYDTFGVRSQNRIINDGINTTEGTGGTGGYYDYYAIEEYQVSAQGADVEMSTPGAQVVAVFKTGGNQLSALANFDWEDESFVTDNIDDDFVARDGSSAPVLEFYEMHLDMGGPLIRDKFWGYFAYNKFFINKAISGVDPDIATDVGDFDEYTAKINAQFTERDQFIGFTHYSLKQKPFRSLSTLIPPESILAQDFWAYMHKAEWQRVWSDRLFSTMMIGHFGYTWPMVPAVDPDMFPPRLEGSTSVRSGAGWQPFDFDRWKPQSTGQFNYYLPTESAGSHDFKFGWDWQLDRGGRGWNTNSGPIRYLDDSRTGQPTSIPGVFVDEIYLANVPVLKGAEHNMHTDLFIQDTVTLNDRVTLNLGVRIGSQDIYNAARSTEALLSEQFPPNTFERSDVIKWWNFAPRLGATIDLTGEGETVFKAYFGRYYHNLGAGIEDSNPAGRQSQTYQFLDPNGNGLYDGSHELGNLLSTKGGGVTAVDPNMKLPISDEFSFSLEHELVADVGIRFSYVRKYWTNFWDDDGVNIARAANLTNPQTVTCTGCPFGLDGTQINVLTVPDGTNPIEQVITNSPFLPTTGGDNTNMIFDTFQFAVTRRFRNNFFLNANFDYQFRNELRSSGQTLSPLNSDPVNQEWFMNHSADIDNRQKTTYWSGKFMARYVAPYEVGLATTVRVQSGFPWAPNLRTEIPNIGKQNILIQNLDEHRSEVVSIVDFRLDKTFNIGGKYQVTGMFDLYNLLNANPETNFNMRVGSSFNEIIEWLPGRTMKLGLRFQF